MGNVQNAGAGLKKMFIASVGSLICLVLLIIPLVNILAAIAVFVFMIMSMIGLYQAGQEIEGCKTAFILTIVNLVVSLAGSFIKNDIMHVVILIAGYVIDFMVIYLVCTSVGGVLNSIGAIEITQKGEVAWKISAVCYVLLGLIAIAMMTPVFGFLAGIIGSIVVLVLSLVAEVCYMIFLSKSSQALGA